MQELLAQKFLTQTNAELMAFFDENDLPGNVVIDLSEFHADPQVIHNELLVTNDYPEGVGAIREPRPGKKSVNFSTCSTKTGIE
jgi:crotonobetainyl-CoA:carnitine CoA-transferase CaiB-like acyl-CoA transferase